MPKELSPEKRRRKKPSQEVQEYDEETRTMLKIKGDFVDRTEKNTVLLEEGNLARIEQGNHAGPSREKKPKVCSTCVYAKVWDFFVRRIEKKNSKKW